MELAVRSGGHSLAGPSTTDAGIHNRSRARGLARGFGDTGSVGIAGITLPGGIGYLVCRHGLTIDSLLAAEIVTADGNLQRTDSETHRISSGAIRGGGGNFGVATRCKFRLHEVDAIVGGMLVLPATPDTDTVASFVADADAAAEDLFTSATVLVAREQRGNRVRPPPRTYMVNVAARFGHPEQAVLHEPWVIDFAPALRLGSGGAYVGFLGEDGRARIHEAYPGDTWEETCRGQNARYAPTNLFRQPQRHAALSPIVSRGANGTRRDLRATTQHCSR